mgnify:CR=1 FL=1
MGRKTTDKTLQNVKDDEPIFVLRAQDFLAPDLVEFWAQRAEIHGSPHGKIAEARAVAAEMRAWQQEHGGGKVPD